MCRTRLEAAQKRIEELTAEDMPAQPGESGDEAPL